MLGAHARHLLQEDLIEDFVRDCGLLTQPVPANQELLFRKDAFLGTIGWRALKELVAVSSMSASHLLPESVPFFVTNSNSPRASRVGQQAQATANNSNFPRNVE